MSMVCNSILVSSFRFKNTCGVVFTAHRFTYAFHHLKVNLHFVSVARSETSCFRHRRLRLFTHSLRSKAVGIGTHPVLGPKATCHRQMWGLWRFCGIHRPVFLHDLLYILTQPTSCSEFDGSGSALPLLPLSRSPPRPSSTHPPLAILSPCAPPPRPDLVAVMRCTQPDPEARRVSRFRRTSGFAARSRHA